MVNEIENNIVRLAAQGDIDAFERIVLSYEKKVYNIAYQMFNNEQDAYDCSQEIFIKLYKNIHSFSFESSFSTWLHRLAVNTCIDSYRKKKRQNQNLESLDEPVETEETNRVQKQFADPSLTPEQKTVQNETVNEVRNAINHLKEEFKVIIILRDIRGHTYEEIAEILECNIGTVKSRIARARSSLKDIILKCREQKP